MVSYTEVRTSASVVQGITAGQFRHLVKSQDVKVRFSKAISKKLAHLQSLDRAQGLREILHCGSSVEKIYYPTLSLAIRQELGFTTRNNSIN